MQLSLCAADRYFAAQVLRHQSFPTQTQLFEVEVAGRVVSRRRNACITRGALDSALEDALQRLTAKAETTVHTFGGPVFEPASEKAHELGVETVLS